MLATSLTAIDTFVDALWLEDGLSRNTLAAYRRDLTLYAQWLAQQQPAQQEPERFCAQELAGFHLLNRVARRGLAFRFGPCRRRYEQAGHCQAASQGNERGSGQMAQAGEGEEALGRSEARHLR